MDLTPTRSAESLNTPHIETQTNTNAQNTSRIDHSISTLNGHAITQMSNSLRRVFGSTLRSAEHAAPFFNYLSSRIPSVSLPNSEVIRSSIDDLQRHATDALTSHVIPGIQNIGESISNLTSSLVQQPQGEIPSDNLGLVTKEEDDYLMITRPEEMPNKSSLNKPNLQDELNKHSKNVSDAGALSHDEDNLLEKEFDKIDAQELEESARKVEKFGRKIDATEKNFNAEVNNIETEIRKRRMG